MGAISYDRFRLGQNQRTPAANHVGSVDSKGLCIIPLSSAAYDDVFPMTRLNPSPRDARLWKWGLILQIV